MPRVSVSIENGAPRFAGSVTLARPVSRAPAGSQAEILEPWRLTGRIDGNSTRAVIEQIEFQYGPDERPIRLRGDAAMTFGPSPQLNGVLSSPQIDLDRMLGAAGSRSAAGRWRRSGVSPTYCRLAAPADPGSASASRRKRSRLPAPRSSAFSGEFSQRGRRLEHREARTACARLCTQVAAGRPRRHRRVDGVSYAGRQRSIAAIRALLVGWLTGRPEAQATTATSLSVDGDFKLGSERDRGR